MGQSHTNTSGDEKAREKEADDSSDERASGTKVTWDSPSDPANPYNWSTSRKWTNVTLISLQATLSPVASSILAVARDSIAADFSLTSPYTPTIPVALFVLGLGFGPLYLAPLSELYGRRWVYIVCFGIFTILNIGCALSPNLTSLSILRFLSGLAGSAGPTLGGGTIGDMFTKKERGKAQAIYGFGPTGGPVIGGLIGGYIVQGTGGWRWTMWVMVIAPGITAFCSLFFLRETYSPVLLRQKAARLTKETAKRHYEGEAELQSKEMFKRSITRPLRMLFTSPVCTIWSIYIAFVYGILYLHLTTIPLLFGPNKVYGLFTYGWTAGNTGLAYLGIGIGQTLGTVICIKYLNPLYAFFAHRATAKARADSEAQAADHTREGSRSSVGVSDSEAEAQQKNAGSAAVNVSKAKLQTSGHHGARANLSPEHRLIPLQVAMLLVPIGLIIFAWTAQNQVRFELPLFGAFITGVGIILGYVCIQTYIVDVYERWAASALAGTILLRSIMGAIFSLIGAKLYERLGYGWGTMLLAFICLAMAPLPMVFYYLGPRLRKKQFVF